MQNDKDSRYSRASTGSGDERSRADPGGGRPKMMRRKKRDKSENFSELCLTKLDTSLLHTVYGPLNKAGLENSPPPYNQGRQAESKS